MEYILGDKLGEGAFGSVYTTFKDGQKIALKIVEIPNENLKERILNEVNLLKEISTPKCFPSIVCFYDSQLIRNTLYLEMEFIKGKNLKEYALSFDNNTKLLYKLLVAIIYDLSAGLKYIHGKGIIHRDIKPENIMITYENQPKLIDIGLGCFTKTVEEKCELNGNKLDCCKGYVGTPLYVAPETVIYNIAYFSSDIYSLGASIYHIAAKKQIFAASLFRGYMQNNANIMKRLKELFQTTSLPKLVTTDFSLNDLINNMILLEPNKRMTPDQIMSSIKKF